jgi:ABC-type branched-subunit amino acid transport system substrate-binding protein
MGMNRDHRLLSETKSRLTGKITNFRLIAFTLAIFSASIFPNSRVLSQTVRIGAALPLFEESGDPDAQLLGKEILNGISFALNEYNRSPRVKVKLITRDTKKDPQTCADAVAELSENDSVEVILGPIFSSELAAVTGIALADEVPVVSPTATGDRLAENHEYIFQLNPSYAVRGRVMADYLVKKLGMQNIAVISESSYGINFSNHFISEVKKLGANIVADYYYGSSTTNILGIIKQIDSTIRKNDLFINIANLNVTQRQRLENAGVRYSLLDSMMTYKTDVSIYYLFGKNAKKIIDTLNIKPHTLKPETSKFIQGYIDAIYIPISNPSEIGMIVPQLFSYGLSFFIAGTGDWNNEKALKDNAVYLKNLVFESEYYLDESNPKVIDLKEMLKATKYKLNKNFLFGYDAMNLILYIISEGNTTREQIYDALNKVKSYDGIKSKITLDYHRINSELNILTYDNGVKLLGTYKLGEGTKQ